MKTCYNFVLAQHFNMVLKKSQDLYLTSQEVKAKSLSAIFVRHIGHSEQASEQDLHTAMANKRL